MSRPVIVVCSAPAARSFLRGALRGLRCAFVCDGDSALRQLDGAGAAGAALVWSLAGRGPLGLAGLERARAAHPLAPTLVLHEPQADGRSRLLRLGAVRVLYEPCSQATVRREVDRLCREAARERAERAPFERLPVAATIVDAEGRLLGANAEARRLAGEPRAGETCREYWQCRVAPSRCPLSRALRGRPVRRAKVALGRPAGCAIERVGVFTDERGRRRGVIVTGPASSFFRRMRELRRQARMDALTRLHNRRSFDALTSRALLAERRRRPAAFLMIDIDGLKAINDVHGHAAGDGVIARMARVLSDFARHGDVVGRVGGDEFAVYCPGARRTDAEAVVRRIERGIREDNARRPGEPRLAAQIGLAWGARPGRRGGDLREDADVRLRKLKDAAHRARAAREGGIDYAPL